MSPKPASMTGDSEEGRDRGGGCKDDRPVDDDVESRGSMDSPNEDVDDEVGMDSWLVIGGG